MKIILSDMCASLVGTLERGLGYHIEHRKNGFFAKRNQRGFVPPDGHWRFIVLCAELAQNHLYISDIQVNGKEVVQAITKAGKFCPAYKAKDVFNASRILTIKKNLGL